MWFRRSTCPRRCDETEPGARSAPLSEGAELAEETDAVLTGRLVDHLVELGRPIPAWAALNRLAHVTFGELVDVVAGRAGGRGRTGWATAERELAFELVTRGWDADGVHGAQMDALVPLELALVALGEPEVTESDVLDMAAEMLADHFAGK